jgi:hypothetical protein
MKPVRVVTPGAGLTLPLRMVAAGVGANVGITLYVLGDGRYEAQNFSNGVVDDSKLVWVTSQSQSNYQTLAANIMAGNGDRTWLTEYAQAVSALGDPSSIATGGGYSCGGQGSPGFNYYGGGATSLATLYYGTCLCQSQPLCGQTLVAPVGPDDASLDALLEAASGDAAADAAQATDAPAESSGDDAPAESSGDDAQGDDGAAGDAGVYEGGLIAPEGGCAATACSGFDDLEVASAGLDPSNLWVTRMRAQVPASVLSEGDLVLQASASQTDVSNRHFASVYDDPAYNPCGNSGSGACAASAPPLVVPGRVLVGGALAFLGVALVRRRRPQAPRHR